MNYTIGGCSVPFPHQAYGTQLSFMGKVISALENGQNALLEAPTGSGKTLSLLCSALAWQKRERARREEYVHQSIAAQERRLAQDDAALGHTPEPEVKAIGSPGPEFQVHLPGASSGTSDILDGTSSPLKPAKTHPSPMPDLGGGGFVPGEPAHDPLGAPLRTKVPRIYYATRTHSQIAQVVKELKRSGHHPRMAVLAAKQHYCVNSHAKVQPSLEEACDDLLKDGNCAYFRGVQSMLNSDAAWLVHDIEDLSKMGKSRKACPYYVSRRWAAEAELVFGPYSYLVDPVIRRSLGIDVENDVIIFDEAHNIEDVSREAASLELERLTMMEAHVSLVRGQQYNNKPDIYAPLVEMAAKVLAWMTIKEEEAVQALARRPPGRARMEPYERIWQGAPLLAELVQLGLGPSDIDALWEAYQAAREEEEAMAQESSARSKENDPKHPNTPAGSSVKAVRVGALALGTVSRLIQIVRMLHQFCDDGGRDYRLVVHRVHHSVMRGGGDRGLARRRITVGDDSLSPPEYMVTMSLWCLNPAVAFRQVAGPCHSVILTSGTLAPLDSFASELGVPFEVRLEAPHVINMQRQVWAGAIGAGPSGAPLLATYQHTDKSQFQDALGATVLSACRQIPDGVLLFLPSYSLLDKLAARWKVTGVWSRLEQMKHVVTEPRGGGPDALQSVIMEYYAAIKEGRGGLFIAVCRGKVSEGIDFADANARGVLVVGIPFPNVKDSKVEAKRKFNDSARALGLLPGSVWYEQQAFRALNQAIGRCIRHRGDWGSILLVDERFKSPKYQKGLSRWVRGALSAPPTFEAASSSLNQFFDRLKADPPQAPARPTAEEEPAKEPDEARKVDAIAMLMAGRNAIAGRNNGTKSKPKVEPGAEPMPAQVPATILTSHSVPLNEMSPGQLGLEAIQAAIKAAPVAQWVASDLNTWGAFVMQQGAATSEFEAMEVAALGILDAFGMAKECAAPGVDDHSWMTKLQVEVPKGLQAVIAAARGGFLPPGTAVDAVAVQFGMAKLSNAPPVVALDAMEAAYRQELASKLPGIGGRQAPLPAAGPFEDGIKRKWEEEVPNGAPDDASGTGHAQKRVLQSERAGMAAAVHQQEHVNRAAEARQQAILEALGSYCEDDDDDDFA